MKFWEIFCDDFFIILGFFELIQFIFKLSLLRLWSPNPSSTKLWKCCLLPLQSGANVFLKARRFGFNRSRGFGTARAIISECGALVDELRRSFRLSKNGWLHFFRIIFRNRVFLFGSDSFSGSDLHFRRVKFPRSSSREKYFQKALMRFFRTFRRKVENFDLSSSLKVNESAIWEIECFREILLGRNDFRFYMWLF